MKEGIYCRWCRKRIPLVQAGEHDIAEHLDDPLVAASGQNVSLDRVVTSDEPRGRAPRSRTDAESYGRRSADVHDPERIAGGVRNRPWSVP